MSDYDLTHIYIDSIYKVANETDTGALESFITKLDAFLKDSPVTATIILSGKVEDLPEAVKAYV